MLTGRSGYDVVLPSGSFLQRQVEAGVDRPLEVRAPLRVTQPPDLEDSRVENRNWTRHRSGQ